VPCSVHTCKLDSTTLATATRTNQQRSWMHSSSNHSKKYGISGVATCKCAPAENTRRQQHISKVVSMRPITKRLPNVFPYKPSTARIKLEIHGNYLSLQITRSQRPNRRWPRPQTHPSHPKPEPRARHEASITPKTGAPSAPRGSPARASEPPDINPPRRSPRSRHAGPSRPPSARSTRRDPTSEPGGRREGTGTHQGA